MYARLQIDFGSGPAHYDVHFGIKGNGSDEDGPEVGLEAVKTAGGDILPQLLKPQIDAAEKAVREHLQALKDSLP